MRKIATILLLFVSLVLTNNQVRASDSPYFNQETYEVFSNVSDPVTIDYLLENIVALDDVDGNITDSIEIILDEYTGNEERLGDYNITLQVVDSDSNTSHLLLQIHVVDVTDPVIEGVKEEYNIDLNESDYSFLEDVTALDNYDGDLTGSIVLDKSNIDFTNYGEYEITWRVTDSSNNYEYLTSIVNVKDMQKPTIEGITSIVKRPQDVMLIEDILSKIVVYDNLDPVTREDIYIIEDFYTGFGDEKGNYMVTIGVKDYHDNETQHVIDVIVTESIPIGTILINDTDLQVPYGYKLTDQDVLSIMKVVEDIDPTKDFAVTYLSEDYFSNLENPGQYDITVKIISNSGLHYEREFQVEIQPSQELEFIEGEKAWYQIDNMSDIPLYISIPGGVILLGLLFIGGTKIGGKKS